MPDKKSRKISDKHLDIEKDPKIKGPIGFLNSYYNSPEFANRGGINVYAGMQAPRYKPVHNRFDISLADPVSGEIHLSDAQANAFGMDINNDVLPHEYSHLTRGLSNPQEALQIASLNKRASKSVPLLKRYMKENDNFYNQKYQGIVNNLGMDSHTIDPDENYADLNSLRYLMYKQGIYDTRKGPMSMEHLQKAMSDPYIKKQFTFKRMLENFEPENIVELNNKVAKNKQVTPSFKNGGTVMPNKTRKIPTTKEVPDFNKQQYDDMAEWNYYMEPLRNKLREKNPDTFDPFTKNVTQARTGGNQFGRYELSEIAGGFKQNPLTEEEIQQSLTGVTPYGGQDPYQRFNALKDQYFAYDELGYNKRPTATPGLSYNQVYPLRTSSYGSPDYEYTPQIVNGQLLVNNKPVLPPTAPLRPRPDVAGGAGFAMGSRGVPARDIKVTDGEFGITPQGRKGEFKGQGGIDNVDATVPIGTKIFSENIKLDGKTMADRAKFRASREARIAKILEKDNHDAIAKNTLKRIVNQNKMQEEQDLQYQEMLDRPQYEEDIPQYAGGSGRYGVPDDSPFNNPPTYGTNMFDSTMPAPSPYSTPMINPMVNTSYGALPANAPMNMSPRPVPSNIVGGIGGVDYSRLDTNFVDPNASSLNFADQSGAGALSGIYGNQQDRAFNIASNLPAPTGGANADLTGLNQAGGPKAGGADLSGAGNLIGGIGTAVNAVAPLLATLANRRATRPNINRFKGYGADAFDTNQAEQDALNFQANENAVNNAISRNTQLQQIDNSTGSLNVGRALKSIATYGADKNANVGNAAFAGQRGDILNRRAQMLLNRDNVVMGGQTAADERNAQDRDAFYTALNRDLGNVGTSFQQYGQTLNQNQYNQDFLEMMPYTSKYGFGFDRDRRGRYKQTVTK